MRHTFKMAVPACLAALAMWSVPAAHAATDTETQNVSYTLTAYATLTLDSPTLTFPDTAPGTGSIAPTEGTTSVTVDARTSTAGAVTLTVQADQDLTSGSDTIAASNLTWTATGSGFQAGTVSKDTPQTVASFTGSGQYTGSVTYALQNSRTYATGAYAATLTYTLTSP